jgi:hypothetical protein
MRTSLILLGLSSALCFLPGCATGVYRYDSPVRPGLGAIYSGFKVPLTTNFTNTPARPSKVGVDRTSMIAIPLLYLYIDWSVGDASIRRAAENGNIKKIHYADMGYYQVLGIVGWYETTVYGD